MQTTPPSAPPPLQKPAPKPSTQFPNAARSSESGGRQLEGSGRELLRPRRPTSTTACRFAEARRSKRLRQWDACRCSSFLLQVQKNRAGEVKGIRGVTGGQEMVIKAGTSGNHDVKLSGVLISYSLMQRGRLKHQCQPKGVNIRTISEMMQFSAGLKHNLGDILLNAEAFILRIVS